MAATPATAFKELSISSPARIPEAANCEATLAAASIEYAVPSTDALTFFITSSTAAVSFNKPFN